MSYTFFKAMGLEIGLSLLEEDRIGVAENLLKRVEAEGIRLLLPVDCVVAPELAEGVASRVVPRDQFPADLEGVDIGPKARRLFAGEISKAKTVLWNGPLGVFEIDAFAEGTREVAEALAEATDRGAVSVLGGGETAAAAAKFGLTERLTHVSTGGGASLEFLEGKVLPSIATLTDKED